jgi:hypothetical protein
VENTVFQDKMVQMRLKKHKMEKMEVADQMVNRMETEINHLESLGTLVHMVLMVLMEEKVGMEEMVKLQEIFIFFVNKSLIHKI